MPDAQTASCADTRPDRPGEATRLGASGLVLVSFLVHPDGHVDNVELRNPKAPQILFDAVKQWLLRCPYPIPPQRADNSAAPVKVIVPFKFKAEE